MQAPAEQEISHIFAIFNSGDYRLAERQARLLTQKYPDHPFGWRMLATVLMIGRRLEEAVKPLRESIRLNPWNAEAHCYLAGVLYDLGRLPEAEASYRHAIRIEPNYTEAYNNLGILFENLLRLTEAEASYRHAIRSKPDYAEAHRNLANVLKDLGRLTEAEASYRQAIQLHPDHVETWSNLLFGLNYHTSLSPELALLEARRFGAKVSAMAVPRFTAWKTNPERNRLRIGMVSGDFRQHPVGYFIEGLLQHLDARNFEVVGFPTSSKKDELTDRIERHCVKWLSLDGLNDPDAASRIHEQGIEILIDLSGHTAHNRLPVFAYKPAPLQVSWLGYFATTGLPEMDYFLGDPHVSPACEQRRFTERIWNLAETWLCLLPPAQSIPVNSLPAERNGYVTFGCFGNLSKVNDAVLNVWTTILEQVPDARFLLKSNQLSDPKVIADVQQRFAKQGINTNRLLLEGRSVRAEYLESFHRIDIVLDTFPYPGGTTSVDALWMGVPVLTLKGDTFLSRIGESIALNAGLSQWIAQNQDDYVAKASVLAADLGYLANLRTNLREQLLQTPLFNSRRFARHFGEALWGMARTNGLRGD